MRLFGRAVQGAVAREDGGRKLTATRCIEGDGPRCGGVVLRSPA